MKACRLKPLSVLFCALLPHLFFAQNHLPQPFYVASATEMLAKACLYFDSTHYAEAEEYAQRSYQLFQTKPDGRAGLAESAYWMGRIAFAQGDYTRANTFLLESLGIRRDMQPEGSVAEVQTCIALGNTFIKLETFDNASKAGQEAIALLNRLGIVNDSIRFAAQALAGRSLYGMGYYNKAIPFYEQALNLAHDYYGEDNLEITMMIIYLGNCLNYCGHQERAIALLERGLAVQQKKLPPVHEQIAGSYMAIGSCQQALNKYDNALDYYEKAAAIRLQLQSPRLAYAYSLIGQIHLDRHEYRMALDYFQKEIEVLLFHKLGKDEAIAYAYRDFGLAYYGIKDFPAAIHWYQEALNIFQGPEKKSGMGMDECSVMLHTGRAQAASGNYEAAFQSFAECRGIIERLFGPGSALLYETNAEIAETYTLLYRSTAQDSFLLLSRRYFDLAIKDLRAQLQAESYLGSERKLLDESLPYFERAIRTELLYLKWVPNDEAVLERVWQLSEFMHAQLLLSATQEAHARHFAGIPDAELLRDSILQSQLVEVERNRRLLAEAGHQLTDSIVLATNAQIFALREDIHALRASFEKNYPDYYHLKYEQKSATLEKTRQLLSPQQTLLEYFTGDSVIYLFVIQRKSNRVLEIPRDFPLTDWVQKFREGISGYFTAAKKLPGLYEKTVRQYADAAQKLYQKLLAPLEGYLTPEIIIVPGDGLADLPFEALLSAAPKDLSNFGTYPFLLHKHSFQYAYSATMLHQMATRQHLEKPSGELLAFAPFFENTTGTAVQKDLSPLPFSGKEVFQVKNQYAGAAKVLTGAAATRQQFLELAAQYKILHLATHGKSNHLAGDFSFLAFASGDTCIEKGLVSVAELYNLPLNADMVVLSACETALGEQHRGEGVVSLARAFAFAGAKSIVASLWSVNDQSTMQVMEYFYTGINTGKAKNIALSEAKLHYLEQNPAQKSHPFFWAGFVGIGDMSPIKSF